MSGDGWSGRRVTEFKAAVLGTKGRVCHLCGRAGADTVDHIVPRSVAPELMWDMDNAVPAHLSCNSSRQDMPLTEWFRRHPIPRRAPPTREW